MRVYIPALSHELSGEHPPARKAWVALIPAGTHPEEAEVIEDDAQTEACLEGLTLLRDTSPEGAKRRIVLAVDIPGRAPATQEADVREVDTPSYTWADVAAVLVDGPEAEEAVRAVIAAEDQDTADEAVAQLWDHALEWFDSSERLGLATALA
ncbi:hypothetical protein [Schaalia sp. Marseille-Q2122]|uniref:DUF6912 family protein n=1 Tax=Schaalia sp. Marseille-Q2122 TaxID=2736604 RepID=UPI001589401A|nr:hypothetical protein [Schaalia sp. Marseille-Q2122]